MIEKVARAIMEARPGAGEGSCLVIDWDAEYADNVHVRTAVDQAKAAIEAMREPTEEMMDAYYEAASQLAAFDGLPAEYAMEAMVDAALKNNPD